MSIKKIQLNSDQLYLVRHQMEQVIWSHEAELKKGGYTESGIIKAIEDIQNASQIIEKLSFDILK